MGHRVALKVVRAVGAEGAASDGATELHAERRQAVVCFERVGQRRGAHFTAALVKAAMLRGGRREESAVQSGSGGRRADRVSRGKSCAGGGGAGCGMQNHTTPEPDSTPDLAGLLQG